MQLDFPERIAEKIDTSGDCWIWTAARFGNGYGAAWWDKRVQQAHRAVYQILVGPIPDGLQLDHLCRNTTCVNPDHLQPVTWRENLSRSPVPHNHRGKSHCKKGHPFAEDTTLIYGPGWRRCRICALDAVHRHRAKERSGECAQLDGIESTEENL